MAWRDRLFLAALLDRLELVDLALLDHQARVGKERLVHSAHLAHQVQRVCLGPPGPTAKVLLVQWGQSVHQAPLGPVAFLAILVCLEASVNLAPLA